MSTFFRYPGGKSKLKNRIISKLKEMAVEDELEYREPFFGGGSIGIDLLKNNSKFKKIWINDLDSGISCLWTALIKYPELLKNRVQNFQPSVELFYQYKSELIGLKQKPLPEIEIVNFGFKKLAIHETSYSGLGVKSGGPLGGKNQKSNYKIDCRWSPKYICKKIDYLHELFSKNSIINNCCTNYDFSDLIQDDSCKAIIYLDPPYFSKGNDLYQHGFANNDHIRLAEYLKNTKHHWVLSYDDCDEIRQYYQWAYISEINDVNYSITAIKEKETGKRISRNKSELLISNKKLTCNQL